MEKTHGKESVLFTRNLWLSLFTVLEDPESNVIFQWKNVTTFRNITQLAFHLTPEPMFGDYTIAVRKLSGMTAVHQFTVNRDGKQVLVLIHLPLSSRQQNKTEQTWGKAAGARLGLCCLLFCGLLSPPFAWLWIQVFLWSLPTLPLTEEIPHFSEIQMLS